MLVLNLPHHKNEAGCLKDPPVSDAREYIASPDATAAAEPPLDPPGTLSTFQG